jgi:hypothetical protein
MAARSDSIRASRLEVTAVLRLSTGPQEPRRISNCCCAGALHGRHDLGGSSFSGPRRTHPSGRKSALSGLAFCVGSGGVTVLTGIADWMIIVHDAASSDHGRPRDRTFFNLGSLAFAIEMGLLMSPAEILRKGLVFDLARAAVVVAAVPRMGERSPAGNRDRRRDRLVHDAERVGHRGADARQDHPLGGGQRRQLKPDATDGRPTQPTSAG